MSQLIESTKKDRNTLSKLSSSKPINEEIVSKAINNHIENQKERNLKLPTELVKSLVIVPRQVIMQLCPSQKRPCQQQLGQNVSPASGPSHILAD